MNKVTVLGAGYVGLTTAATLCKDLDITVRDVSIQKIRMLNNQECPIVEPDMCDALFDTISRQIPIKFEALDLGYTWLLDTDYVIVAVGTPTVKGSLQADTSAIDHILDHVKSINSKCKVVIKSTVPITYCDTKAAELGLQIMHIPEFLRQGYAISDATNQLYTIVGKSSNVTEEEAQETAAVLFNKPMNIVVPNKTAALAKLARNTFLALHIAYANELNLLCKSTDIDYCKLRDLMELDSRINCTYMTPSPGYGGSCLPKDTRSLAYQYSHLVSDWLPGIAKQQGLLNGLVNSNLAVTGSAYAWVLSILEKYPDLSTVGICGLTFKSNTDDTRESRYYDIAKALMEDTMHVRKSIMLTDSHDAVAAHYANDKYFTQDLAKVMESSDILIINHSEYADFIEQSNAKVIIDFTDSIKPMQGRGVYTWTAR